MSSVQTLVTGKIFSDDFVEKSGFYLMGKHIDDSDGTCKPLISEQKMFFARGSKAPRPLSCLHKVEWWPVSDD